MEIHFFLILFCRCLQMILFGIFPWNYYRPFNVHDFLFSFFLNDLYAIKMDMSQIECRTMWEISLVASWLCVGNIAVTVKQRACVHKQGDILDNLSSLFTLQLSVQQTILVSKAGGGFHCKGQERK